MTFPLLLYMAKAEKHLRMYFRRRFSYYFLIKIFSKDFIGVQYHMVPDEDIRKFNRFYKKQTKIALYSSGS